MDRRIPKTAPPTLVRKPPARLCAVCFRVGIQDARAVRMMLLAQQDFGILRCTPIPARHEVDMIIAYESGCYRDLVTTLIGCVPCGEFRQAMGSAT